MKKQTKQWCLERCERYFLQNMHILACSFVFFPFVIFRSRSLRGFDVAILKTHFLAVTIMTWPILAYHFHEPWCLHQRQSESLNFMNTNLNKVLIYLNRMLLQSNYFHLCILTPLMICKRIRINTDTTKSTKKKRLPLALVTDSLCSCFGFFGLPVTSRYDN